MNKVAWHGYTFSVCVTQRRAYTHTLFLHSVICRPEPLTSDHLRGFHQCQHPSKRRPNTNTITSGRTSPLSYNCHNHWPSEAVFSCERWVLSGVTLSYMDMRHVRCVLTYSVVTGITEFCLLAGWSQFNVRPICVLTHGSSGWCRDKFRAAVRKWLKSLELPPPAALALSLIACLGLTHSLS